jgi:predicted MPP superfamily phosphohydrolase
MHKLSFVFFFAVFITVYLGMHYYVYTRIANGLLLAGGWRLALKVLFVAGAASFFAGEMLGRRTPSAWLEPFMGFGEIWLGTIAIALTAFALTDILRVFFHGPSFRYSVTLAGLIVTLAASGFSVINVALPRNIREISVPTNKLPKGSSFTIAQLSDIHVNSFTSPKWLQAIVDQANSLNPDLIVMTGDLIDADMCRFPKLCETWRGLRAKYGVYAITGNHEFYTGLDKFMRTADVTNMKVLRNEAANAGDLIELVGIDDDVSALGIRAEDDIIRAMNTPVATDPAKLQILLSHRPDTFDAAAHLGFTLQLSGHTHGGQIPPIDFLTFFAFKYPLGLYHKGATTAYVTSGTAFWGPPMRLTSRSEIVKIVLTSTK